MFWGLVLEPSKRYTQKVQQSFHISQAALEINTADFEPVQLILEYDGANYVLATLSRKFNVYQIPLDLNFNTGDQISFRTIGKGRVHLTGYHILEDDLEDMVLNGEEQSDVEEEEEEESSPSKLDSSKQVKRKKPDSSKNVKNKKSKLSGKNEVEASEEESDDEDAVDDYDVDMSDSDDEDDGDEEDDECEEEEEDDEDEDDDDDMELGDADEDEDDEDLEEEDTEGKKKPAASNKLNKSNVSINGKSPKNKKLNDSKGTPKPDKKNAATPGKDSKEVKTPKSEKKSPKSEKKGKENKGDSSPQKKVLEGGVVVEEIKIGEGQAAKPGKMAQVYYVGRLQSNKKQFDATTQGPGFRFRLGKGEVIRGWDIGVSGMKVGGKRRITIPPQLAYGAKGAPPAIPPNSTLVFEVELKGLN